MAGTLFVVATPIGHLEDITQRALRVLRDVSVVAAEDTRRTGNLLRHFGIATRLVSLHAHNEHYRAEGLIADLREGRSVALVSDAGTPGISDPGAGLVRAARAAGMKIEAVPGASAVAAAVSLAGLDEGGFAFLGFPPHRGNDRKKWFETLDRLRREVAVVFFEAPHRMKQSLEALDFLGEQQILVFRELTKLHEETLTGTTAELRRLLPEPLGEFTVVVPKLKVVDSTVVSFNEADVVAEFGQMAVIDGSSRRTAARAVGKKFGLSARQVYEMTKNQQIR
jgi:16S rRNA (cytidine1402-2'-O)-methyltransferase